MRVWKLLVASMFAICGLGTSSLGNEQDADMIFERHGSGGNCIGCEWIYASGRITSETPFLFKRQFGDSFSAYALVLNSPGGDLAAGLELGRELRRLGVRVGIGSSVPNPASPNTETVTSDGICVSACAYAFLGGLSRSIDNEKQIGFHQFFDTAELAGADSVFMSGVDEIYVSARDQYITGMIVDYINEMEVSAQLYPIAAAVGPADPIRYITMEEAGSLRIDNSVDGGGPWDAVAFNNGLVAEIRTIATNRKIRLYCTQNGTYHLTVFYQRSNSKGGEVAAEELRARYSRMGNSFQIDAGGEIVSLQISYVGAVKKSKELVVVADLAKSGAIALARGKSFRVISGANFTRVDEAAFYDFFRLERVWGGNKEAELILKVCI